MAVNDTEKKDKVLWCSVWLRVLHSLTRARTHTHTLTNLSLRPHQVISCKGFTMISQSRLIFKRDRWTQVLSDEQMSHREPWVITLGPQLPSFLTLPFWKGGWGRGKMSLVMIDKSFQIINLGMIWSYLLKMPLCSSNVVSDERLGWKRRDSWEKKPCYANACGETNQSCRYILNGISMIGLLVLKRDAIIADVLWHRLYLVCISSAAVTIRFFIRCCNVKLCHYLTFPPRWMNWQKIVRRNKVNHFWGQLVMNSIQTAGDMGRVVFFKVLINSYY